jgi:hypothetical protein
VEIAFYAHASFRLEADGLTVITDPYTPGPQPRGFDPINEPADHVIMSSATDAFHSDLSHARGNPTVINALELPPEGSTVRGLHIRSFPAMESFTFYFGRDPDANALYLFTLGGIHVLHMGDIGNPVSPAHLDALRRNAGATQLNRTEGRHSVARIVFSSKRGELRQRYREGQEDQLGALGLVVNMIVLWNTIYMEAVLEQLRKEGYSVNEEDKARLSPLIHDHINTHGRHSFAMPEAVVKGELRPLRNPADDLD